jgi:hypothetical protein
MRRFVLLLIVSLSAAGTFAAGAAVAAPLTGSFTIQFPKGHEASNAPCAEDTFCGVGTLSKFGAATITIVEDTYDEIPGTSCFAHTRVEEIEVLDGSGTLALESEGTFCRPGRSGDSHASPSSYGSPGVWNLTYTVIGPESTGIFAGATGSGTETMRASGGIGVWHLAGTVNLAD